MFTAAITTVVQEDQLGHVAQRGPLGSVVGVVGARATVQEQHRRAAAHLRPVGHQFRPFDVKEESYTVDGDVHARP